jgi:nucleotide-binding universal stress UspA family protein
MSEKENGRSQRVPAVVVGVDGSAGSNEALGWALAEARLRNVPLRIVHAWISPGVRMSGLQRAAEELVEKAARDVAAGEDVEIERLVVQGTAAEVLLAAVDMSDLLVVGSRGHGGFADLLLGSVSQQCVHHAPCPVVVVHLPKPMTKAGERALEGEERTSTLVRT